MVGVAFSSEGGGGKGVLVPMVRVASPDRGGRAGKTAMGIMLCMDRYPLRRF